ncbi:hypothetical protein JDS78_28900 [Bacillus cereus group sp. N17]|uniref:hypothetical protein n=1 Tax=Bacillus cereus group sp. N17 TaxID=2794589 RepID=UPI0018F36EDC|nr:hypothetical protein [Bacillus cereus group sp. N17]MBJ8044202.1 hypothetical protein [Bacillus cereus group sp. N17]
MSYINCPKCSQEYYLRHMKTPTRERGEVLRCDKCNGEVFRYNKGTDDYRLFDAEEYRAKSIREENEFSQYPTCYCDKKMVPRTGPYGDFFACADYKNGCGKTVKR